MPAQSPHPLSFQFRQRIVVFLVLGSVAALLASERSWAEGVDFVRDIRPIISENCVFCHGPDEQTREAGLRLDNAEGAWSVLEKGMSSESELMRRVTSEDPDEVMPPPDSNRRLGASQIERLRQWIDQGAAWEQHWSFRPLVAPEIPIVPADSDAPIRNPIDAFVQNLLSLRGMKPSPEATRETLIRRLSLDLTGLPPTPEQVDAFVNDSNPRAYERLVDRLLESPAYGQRMAWDWLDAARYADTNGYQGDNERTMWPWRDWVVDAFNRNLPYDQFTVWQLAGDLLPNATFEQKLATGFSRNHMINGEGGRIPEENRVEYVMDMTETMGTVWLGMTLNCCRCHDHKYDPITNAEYYKLFAFFNQTPIQGGGGNPQTPPNLAAPSEEQSARLAQLESQIASLDRDTESLKASLVPGQSEWEARQKEVWSRPANWQTLRAAKLEAAASELQQLDDDSILSVSSADRPVLSDDIDEELVTAFGTPVDQQSDAQRARVTKAYLDSIPAYQTLEQKRAALVKQLDDLQSNLPKVMVMADMPEPRQTFMLSRGQYNKPTDEVVAALPEFLPEPQLVEGAGSKPLNRLTLARWLVDPSNPLTPRVTVNRFWQQIFGIGLVKTTEDFGAQGEIPVHLDLLNWLAWRFEQDNWDVKNLMRLIVTSHTYRQSSKATGAEDYERDPENRLLARGARYRMPAWMLRDQALFVSGLLSAQGGGPAVNSYQPAGVWEEATFGKKQYRQDSGEKLYRRSLYVFWRRIIAPTMFFDNASRQTCTVKLSRTNTPLHALQTLNDIAFVEAARTLAQQVLISKPLDRSRVGESIDDEHRVDQVMRRVLARPASDREKQVLLRGLQRSRAEFADDPSAASALLAVGDSAPEESLDAVEHAAWTSLCLAVLNLDESLNRE